MTTQWFSLRRRLFGLLLGGIALAWSVMMLLSYLDAHHEIDELFDAQLAQSAQTLLALANDEDGEWVGELGDSAHEYQRRLRFQIWRRDGRLMMRSENAPITPLTVKEGFSELSAGDEHWLYFSRWNNEGTLQVQVSEDHHIRDELIASIAWRLLLPALFGLPLIGLGVWLATRHGLATLDAIAIQIANRAPQQLQAIVPARAPEEIRPILDALNHLFQRVDQTLEAERRFTADAAHELRTPLAALQVQTQVAQHARDDAERERSLGQLQIGLTRAAHLVDQMLLLARLDPESGLPNPQAIDLATLAEDVCADLGTAILDKQLDFDFTSTPDQRVHGQYEWLRVALRNLLDNAIRYTPRHGHLQVTVAGNAEHLWLEVCDDGPGIPAEEHQFVLERFHRLHRDDTPGSGLGLPIVARIAALHQARLELADGLNGRGLGARIVWSRHTAPPDTPD